MNMFFYVVDTPEFVQNDDGKTKWYIKLLGGGFKYCLFSPLFGEGFQFE